MGSTCRFSQSSTVPSHRAPDLDAYSMTRPDPVQDHHALTTAIADPRCHH